MLDSVKGGCCGWTARTTGGTNSTDSKRDRPGVAMEEQQYQAVEDKAIEPLLADESAIAFPR
ncbi:hypothetical protein [uncultured Algibacter sp.]|uniref:hypothetical protein n=1 Tax=uncultured Algibacter sp. TaxID=298659 RepID=UPI0032170715